MECSSSNKFVTEQIGEECQYPYPSNISAKSFIRVKLSRRDDYIMWSTQMSCFLKSHDMFGFIDGTFVRPQMSDSGKQRVDDNHNNHRLGPWGRSDALVKGWIVSSLSNKTLGYLVNGLTAGKPHRKRINIADDDISAKDVWDELETMYAPADEATMTKEKEWAWIGVSSRTAPFTVSTILPQLKNKEHKYNVNGYGASGEVYKIKPDQSRGFVVVKKISNKVDLHKNPINIEVDILKKIQNENIVEMIGYFLGKNNTLILYPYFENGSLVDCLMHRNQAPPSPGLNGSVLDWPTRIRIAFGVAQGLKHMHDYTPAVFHGNLKSSNILLDEGFIPKIADFESAKFVEGREYADTTKQDKEKDFFYFGVILLELLTGKEYYKKKQRLATWAHDLARGKTQIDDVLDEAIKDTMPQKDIRNVFDFAMWCTNKEAKARDRLDLDRVLKSLKKLQS